MRVPTLDVDENHLSLSLCMCSAGPWSSIGCMTLQALEKLTSHLGSCIHTQSQVHARTHSLNQCLHLCNPSSLSSDSDSLHQSVLAKIQVRLLFSVTADALSLRLVDKPSFSSQLNGRRQRSCFGGGKRSSLSVSACSRTQRSRRQRSQHAGNVSTGCSVCVCVSAHLLSAQLFRALAPERVPSARTSCRNFSATARSSRDK